MKSGVLNKMSDSGKEKQPHELCKQDYSTSASRVADAANVRIKPDIAIENLKKLGALYKNVTSVRGFLTDLRLALGISDSDGSTKYGVVDIYSEDGSSLTASLAITNHNANASTYIEHNANYEYNLRILVRKRYIRNKFRANNKVRLDEYVYYEERLILNCKPLSLVIDGIINFLRTGVYEDKTKVAFKNVSP